MSHRLGGLIVVVVALAGMTCPRDQFEAWIAPESTAENLTVVFGDSRSRERPVFWEGLVVFRYDARDVQVWSVTDTSHAGQGARRSRITIGESVSGAKAIPGDVDLVPGCYWMHAQWQQNDLRFRIDSAGQVRTLPATYAQSDEVRQPHRLMSCLIMTSPYRPR